MHGVVRGQRPALIGDLAKSGSRLYISSVRDIVHKVMANTKLENRPFDIDS